MNFHGFARIIGLSSTVWLAGAAPEPAVTAELKAPGPSLDALIQDLANEKYRVREEASRKLWEAGEPALAELEAAADGKDPERAYRARELIRKIQLHITPDTDPAVIDLVERYSKASQTEKINLFGQMFRRRAWRQILKLHANERNPEFQARLQESLKIRGVGGMERVVGIGGVAVIAARECLVRGDAAGAREYLEMAPADAAGLLALADFHRSQGTLETEIERAKALEGPRAAAWLLALHRAAGDVKAARVAAEAAGEPRISAVMAALAGDPLPWLRENPPSVFGSPIHKPYIALAIKRWQGEPILQEDLEPLARSLRSRNEAERHNGINSLFLLGETKMAEDAYVKASPLSAFAYLESLERIPEAIAALGLDPDQPDYRAWVEKRLEGFTKDDAEDEHDVSLDIPELLMMANFLDRRGLKEEYETAFLEPLALLAEENDEAFTDLLTWLFGSGETRSGAPGIARAAAVAWAGNEDSRWGKVVTAAFGGENGADALWEWLADLDPAATRPERFDGMLAIHGIGPDPRHLREKWLDLAWQAIDRQEGGERNRTLAKMSYLLRQSPDVASDLKLHDLMPETMRAELSLRGHMENLPAAGRWDEAAEIFLEQIDGRIKSKQDPNPSLHAYAAGCLRRAGRIDEAEEQDQMADKLSLGNDAYLIASGYAYAGDYERAADWWEKAARQCDAASDQLSGVLQSHSEMLLEQGKWLEAAAICEVMAQMGAAVDSNNDAPLARLRLRLQSDMGRALANLEDDRAGSIAILENAHRLFPSDGSLADHFFPSLRRVGLMEQHDKWFEISWNRVNDVIAEYPTSDNSRNTAGWLASRARRHLPEAEKHLQEALALSPRQSAYLDTMAEIQFAKGDRAKALEWSQRAVNFMPLDPMLRRQQERFRTAPLPR